MTSKNIYHKQFVLDTKENDDVAKFFSGYFNCNGIKSVSIYYEDKQMVVEVQGSEDLMGKIDGLQ